MLIVLRYKSKGMGCAWSLGVYVGGEV